MLRKGSSLRVNARWLSYRELRTLLIVLLPVAGIWSFLELADDVVEGETDRLDRQIMLLLRSEGDPSDPLGPPWLEEMMRDFTALGGFGVLLSVIGAVAGYLILRKSYGALGLVLASTGGGLLLTFGLKHLFDRPRPDFVSHLSIVSSPSFPSGHSTMAAVVYLTLAALVARLTAPARFKVYLLAVALAATFLVGVSRIYLGVHYPADVLGGWVLGLSWAIATWLVAHKLRARGQIAS